MTEEDDTQPIPEVSEAEDTVILVDYIGDGRLAARLPVLAMGLPEHDDLFLHPGLNPIPDSRWTAFESHPGVAKRVESGEVVADREIPRGQAPLIDLIARTYSRDGLDQIEDAEIDRPGPDRLPVLAAAKKQRARVRARSKGVAPVLTAEEIKSFLPPAK